jgi:hypothetical protein
MKNITFCQSYRRIHVTTEFNALSRLEFIGAPTPLEYLPRFSDYLGRDIFIKRDDVTPMAMGATSCASWSFWRRMRCAKARIRSLPPGLSSPTTFVRRRQWRQSWAALRGAAGKPDWHAGRKLSHQR